MAIPDATFRIVYGFYLKIGRNVKLGRTEHRSGQALCSLVDSSRDRVAMLSTIVYVYGHEAGSELLSTYAANTRLAGRTVFIRAHDSAAIGEEIRRIAVEIQLLGFSLWPEREARKLLPIRSTDELGTPNKHQGTESVLYSAVLCKGTVP